jgi:hypothetical protein
VGSSAAVIGKFVVYGWDFDRETDSSLKMMRSLSVVMVASAYLIVIATGYIIDPPIPVPRTAYGILYNKPASPRPAVSPYNINRFDLA